MVIAHAILAKNTNNFQNYYIMRLCYNVKVFVSSKNK